MSGSDRTDDTSFLRLPESRSFASVKKSIDLLNEAVKTPGIHQRPAPFPHADYTPFSMASTSLFDVSDSTRIFGTPAAKASVSGLSFAAPTTPGSLFRQTILGQTNIEEDMTMTDVNLLLYEDPGAMACRGMFGDFAESFKSGLAQHELFEPISRYEQICSDNVMLLKNLAKRSVPSHSSFARTNEMLSLLKTELHTWRLISSLFIDRFDTERFANENQDEIMLFDQSMKATSEKKLVSTLFERDPPLRQAQLVVDWLEHSVVDDLEELYHKVEYSIDKMGAWENTLHWLKQNKSLGGRGAGMRSHVDRLDPDAPLRQGRQLLDQDVEDDISLLEYMFACVRSGQISEAQRVCTKIGQMWRAATLAGWQLYHDPNVDELGRGGSVQSVEGNQYRDIWKAACWKASEDQRLPLVERALYATLCGNLSQLLPYCKSWYDYVWAYFKAMVDQRVESHIRTLFNGPRPLLPLPSSYNEDAFTYERIFTEIQSCTIEAIRKQCSKKFNQIQKYIITGDIDSLLDLMSSWCMDKVHPPPHHLLRFMAHLILFFRTIAVNVKDDQCICVLEAYVLLLINEKQNDLVAPYVATLPTGLQVQWYAMFLEGIQGTEVRRRCLDLAESCELDVLSITKLVVENIRSSGLTDFASTVESLQDTNTTEDDLKKIDALEWLTFHVEQRPEALRQANAMMRIFLGLRKLHACRLALRKVPSDSVGVIGRLWRSKAGDADLPADVDNAIREYLCIQAYLDAHESFTDWFEHCHNARPKQPEISFGATFSERVAHEHRESQYQMELDRWQHSLELQTNITVERIYNVLLFVDGGWLVDRRFDEDKDESRSHQMMLLRRLCLPMMCALLHQVLHSTKRYKECLQIADHIASEHEQLYKVFRTDELQNFLKKIRESAVALLDTGCDPLGYPLS